MANIFNSQTRRADRAPKVVCKCGKEYTLGVNGTVHGCDECQGTARASNGYVIESCSCFERVGDNDKCPEHGGSNAGQ